MIWFITLFIYFSCSETMILILSKENLNFEEKNNKINQESVCSGKKYQVKGFLVSYEFWVVGPLVNYVSHKVFSLWAWKLQVTDIFDR